MAKMVRLRLNIGSGSGSAHECSASAKDSKPFEAKGDTPHALFALESPAIDEHA